MNAPRFDHPRSTADMLSPARLQCLAGELDVAGDALKVLGLRQSGDKARFAFTLRATRCYAAAVLLRRIAE